MSWFREGGLRRKEREWVGEPAYEGAVEKKDLGNQKKAVGPSGGGASNGRYCMWNKMDCSVGWSEFLVERGISFQVGERMSASALSLKISAGGALRLKIHCQL